MVKIPSVVEKVARGVNFEASGTSGVTRCWAVREGLSPGTFLSEENDQLGFGVASLTNH